VQESKEVSAGIKREAWFQDRECWWDKHLS
jgi:hypothetical protein